MYRIVQPLNNNVALVKNEQGEQAVVMGLGIVFKKKKGDILFEEGIEKTFLLKSQESRENFLTLLKDVPLDFITMGYEIVNMAVERYHYPVQEYIYVTLTDHIYCSYQALRKGTYRLTSLPDMSDQYPEEYQIATEGIEMLKKKLSIIFPEEEVGRLALHFMNAKGEAISLSAVEKQLKQEILELVESELSQEELRRTDKNHNVYDRLMIHLTYLLERLEQRKLEESSVLESLAQQIEKDYPQAYGLAGRIYDLIGQEFSMELHENERVYLALHIHRLMQENK